MAMHDASPNEAIAIIGMAGRFPGARNIGEFWRNLLDGVGSISALDDDQLRGVGVLEKDYRDPNYVKFAPYIENAAMFDAAFFGISPREAETLDPQARVFLETCHTSLEHAGYDPGAFDGRIGVYAGARISEYLERNLQRNRAFIDAVGGIAPQIGNHTDYLASSVAYRLNLRGPAISAVTACSTSLVATHLACGALRNGECEAAIAGGVEIPLPVPRGYFYSEGGLLSPDGQVRPFDANARGTVFGAGSGAIVLRRLRDALADRDPIHAVILGSALNNDGSAKSAFAAPGEDGQAAAVAAALRDAAISPTSVGFVEAHGTGTIIGDPIEVAALSRAYASGPDDVGRCALASVKGNVGHLGAAAGVCGLIKAVHCVREGLLPASLNFDEPNPRIDFDSSFLYVNQKLSDWPAAAGPRRAGVSAFGVGGTNAHLVIEQPPMPVASVPGDRHRQLITISAATTVALDILAEELATHLADTADDTSGDIGDVAYTLNVGRADLAVRRAFSVRDRVEAITALQGAGPAPATGVVPRGVDRSVAFLFPGQGSQYPLMARGLYRHEPTFAARLDWCADVLRDSHGLQLLESLFPESADDEAAHRLARTEVTQPALFAVEYALAELLCERVVDPVAMLGHSVGEYVAACLSGVLGVEDALQLVADRGALVGSLPGGSMLAVMLPEQMLRPMLPDELDLAAVNAPGVCVVSGAAADVQQFADTLAVQGILGHQLHTSHAFHSRMLDPILDEFRERVAAVRLSAPGVPFVSNVTGTWMTDDDATSPDYWVRQLRGCVRFSDGLRELAGPGGHVFAEVGPGRSLTNLVEAHTDRSTRASSAQVGVPLLRQAQDDGDDLDVFVRGIGQLWAAGAPVDWTRYWPDESRRRVVLPTYPYQRERFWVDPEPSVKVDVAGEADDDGLFYVPAWQEAPVPPSDGTAVSAEQTTWLVFGRASVPTVRLTVQRLRSDGARVLLVEPGGEFTERPGDQYTVGVRDTADYARVVGRLAPAEPERIRILHAWNVGDDQPVYGERGTARDLLDHGFLSALIVLQELARALGDVPVEICVATSGMQDVIGDGRVVPAKAAVLGLVRTVRREFEAVTCRSVDLAPDASPMLAAAQLHGEITSHSADREVAYRGRKRWTLSYRSVPLAEQDRVPGALREHGVYVITGGLGAIGLELARQLAELVGARMVLVARTVLPERDKWPAIVAEARDDDPLAARLRALLTIEDAGGAVLVCAGDVADEVRMAEVRAEAVRTFGPVDGVFHLAGVPGGGLLETRSHEAVAAVQRPKVAGTYTLDEVFRPELFVLYSSIAATSGFLGEGDYAGANSVLDAFAQARWGSGRHVVSIDWAPWIDKGMARDTGGPALLRDLASGLGPARPVDHPMLRSRRERTNGDEEFAAYDIDLTPALWVLADHQMVDVPANVAAGPTIPATGVVELIRAAYADHSGAASCEIGDLIFVRPLTAEPGLAARAELRRVADGRFEVNVIGRMTGRPDTLYARGRIGPAPDGRPGVHDLAQLWTRCPDDTGDRLVSPGGIALGPRWDVITSRRSGPDLDLVTIRLPDRFGEDIDVYVAHPSMLDKACGLGMILPSEGTYLPLGYERMIVHRPLPARCVSIIRHVDDVRDDVLRADVTVVDEDGRELVVITGFTMLRMTGDGTSVVSAAAAAPAESVAVRTTAPTDVDGDGDHGATYLFGERVTGISTAGAANALRAILDSGIGPQVIVCPGGLTDWMRRADRVNLASLNGQPTLSVHSGGTRDLAIAYAAPTTEAEQQLVQLWQDAIGIDLVGIDDEFLELGGNSLVAVQLVARISEQFRSRVSVAQLFESKTVRSLAATMGKNE
jgi:acyl transferase domain-containing protein/acyl carrier protein